MRTLLAKARASFQASDNVLARIVTLNIAGKAGNLVVGFFASVALARVLGPSDRGLLALMIAAASLGLAFLTIGVPLAVVYFASRRDADQPGLLGNSILQAELLTLVIVPAVALLNRPIADALGAGHGGRTWILVAALIPIMFLDYTTHGQLQGLLRFGRSSLLVVLSRVASLIGVLTLVGVLGLGVAGGVIATALGSIVTICGSIGPILRYGSPRINLNLLRRTIHYGFRVQLGSLFQLANGRLDVIVMQFFRPLAQVGYYVVAQTIAEIVINLAGAFQVSLLPLISSYEGDERGEATTIESMHHHGILAAAAVLANAVLGPLIIYVAFGARFASAIVPMLVLLPGIWFLGMGIVIQGDLGGRGRPGLSSGLAGLAAVVTVLLDFVLIPPLGVLGGALASDGAYTTFGVASLIALRRVSGISVRQLVVPKRADFDHYRSFLRRASSAVRAAVAARTKPQA